MTHKTDIDLLMTPTLMTHKSLTLTFFNVTDIYDP